MRYRSQYMNLSCVHDCCNIYNVICYLHHLDAQFIVLVYESTRQLIFPIKAVRGLVNTSSLSAELHDIYTVVPYARFLQMPVLQVTEYNRKKHIIFIGTATITQLLNFQQYAQFGVLQC